MEFQAHFLRLFLTHCSPVQISEDLRSYMSGQYPARVWEHRRFMSGHLFWWVGDPSWEEDVKSLLLRQFSFPSSRRSVCMSRVSLALVTNKLETLSFSCNRNTTDGIIHDSLKISYFDLVIQQMRKVKLTKQEAAPRLTRPSPWSRTQVFWSLILLYIPSSSSQLLPRAGVAEKLRNRE